jgi:hypothetical protein
MEYEESAAGFVYLIKSDRGYWLPGGLGYTQDKDEAGRFTVTDMHQCNLDGCTLQRDIPVRPRAAGKFLGD